MTPKPAESTFLVGSTVDQVRAAFLALPSQRRSKVYNKHRFRPRNAVFFHPTQQLEDTCPSSSLFFLHADTWNTHMKRHHPDFFQQHATPDAKGTLVLNHLHSKYCLGKSTEGLACRGEYAGKQERPDVSDAEVSA